MRKLTLQEHLQRAIIDFETGCLLIPKNATHSIRINGELITISKLIYEEKFGELPSHSRIDRICNNGNCINLNHMLPSRPWDKFWRFVDKSRTCWEWTGSKDGGNYGVYRSPNLPDDKAHRLSWIFYNTEIPEGLLVCHKCDNPSCVNPNHLFLGTDKDNVLDKMNKGRFIKMRGKLNGRCKLSVDDVRDIRELHNDGLSYKQISKIYSIGMTQIGRIIRGESWSWL